MNEVKCRQLRELLAEKLNYRDTLKANNLFSDEKTLDNLLLISESTKGAKHGLAGLVLELDDPMQGVPFLKKLLNDEDPLVIVEAAATLALLGKKDGLNKLTTVLKGGAITNSNIENFYARASYAILNLPIPESIGSLRSVFAEYESVLKECTSQGSNRNLRVKNAKTKNSKDFLLDIQAHCPELLAKKMDPVEIGSSMGLKLDGVLAKNLGIECINAVIGHLSDQYINQKKVSDNVKNIYLTLLLKYHSSVQQNPNTLSIVEEALRLTVDDVSEYRWVGSYLRALRIFNFDFSREVRKIYKSENALSYKAQHRWFFYEYLIEMKMPEPNSEMIDFFRKTDASEVRAIFTHIQQEALWNRYSSDAKETLIKIIKPSLNDTRLTNDVDGPGSALKTFAENLITTLKKTNH